MFVMKLQNLIYSYFRKAKNKLLPVTQTLRHLDKLYFLSFLFLNFITFSI